MALTEEQMDQLFLEFTRLDSGSGIVYFGGNVPRTHDEMNTYVLSSDGHEAALRFTKAYRENANGLQDIPNMAEFIAEYVHPAFDNRELTKPTKAKLVAKKLEREDSLNSLLEASAENALDLEAKKAAYKAAKKEGSDLWWKQRGEELSALGDNLTTLRVMAGVGATKAAGIAAGGFMQLAATCNKLATNCYLMARNTAEDTPEVLSKMSDALIKGINDTLKAVGSFLHEVKKSLDPMRSIHHAMKEIPKLMDAQLAQAEKERLRVEDQMQADKIKNMRAAGNTIGAALIEKSGTPTVRAERKRINEAAAAKLEAEMKEAELAHKELQKKLNEELALKAKTEKRAAEFDAVADKAAGVYAKVKDEVVGKLRSRSVSSASDVEDSKAPSPAGARPRSPSTPERV